MLAWYMAQEETSRAWEALLSSIPAPDVVVADGGPGFATEVLYTGVYKEFGLGRYAVGTTLSTIMTLVMLIVGYFMIKHMVKGDGQEI